MAVMDIIVRAQDQASRVFRTVTRASRDAERRLQSLGATVARIQKQFERGFELDLDTTSFVAKMENAESTARGVRDRILSYLNEIRMAAASGAEFEVSTDGVAGSQAALASLVAAVQSLDGTNARIEASVSGFATSMAQMKTMGSTARRLSTQRYGLNFDSASAILATKALGDTLGIIQEFQTTAAVVHAVAVPAMIAAFGGLVSTLGAVAGAAGSAAIAIGQGLAGAVSVAGGALVLGASGLYTYAGALRSTIGLARSHVGAVASQREAISSATKAVALAEQTLAEATPGTRAHGDAVNYLALAEQQLTNEQNKMNALMQATTPELIGLSASLGAAEVATIGLGAAIAQKTAPALVTFIDTGVARMAQMQPFMLAMVSAMNRVGLSFLDAAQKGQNLESIKTILFGIMQAGPLAFAAITNSVLLLINVYAPLVQYSLDFLRYLSAMSGAAAAWSATGEGQQAIADTWALLVQRGQQLWSVAANLSVALWGVAAALNASGTVDRMILGMVNLTGRFREFMSVTGQGRASLTEFMITAQPVFTALGSLAGAAVTEIFRIAGAIMNAKAAGSELPILAQFFYDVQGAIAPIGRLIETNFVLMAPRLGPLIENLAKLSEVFLQAQPPLLAFLDGANRFLDWFTALDPKIQIGIAKVASWGVALYMLSGPIGAAVGFIGRLGGGISKVAGWFTKGSATFGTFGARLAPLLSRVPLLGGALAALTGPVGLVVAAVGLLAAGAVVLANNWDRVRGVFSGDSQTVLENLGAVAQRVGTAIKTFLVDSAQRLADLWSRIWPVIQEVAVNALNGLVAVGQRLGTALAPAIQDLRAGFVALQPALIVLGTFLKGVLIGAFQALWPVVKMAATIIGVALVAAIRIGAMAFRQIAEAVGWVGQKLLPFLPIVQKVGQVIGFVFATVVVGAIGKAIQIIGRIFPVLARFGPALNAVRQTFMGLYNAGVAIWGMIFRLISGIVGRLVTFIGARFTQGLNLARTIFQTYFTTLFNIWSRIFTSVSGFVQRLVAGVQMRWNALRTQTNQVFNSIWNFLQGLWNRILSMVQGIVNRLVSAVQSRWNTLSQRTQEIFGRIRDTVVNRVEDLRKRATDAVERLKNGIQDAWQNLPNFAREIFSRVASSMVEKLEGGINRARSWLGSLMTAIANVADAIGMDEIAGSAKSQAAKLKEPIKMATGGVVSQMATGGIASGVVPRVVYGEAKSPEAYIVKNRSTREQLPYLQTAAAWHGYGLMKRPRPSEGDHTGATLYARDLTRAMARGGVTGGCSCGGDHSKLDHHAMALGGLIRYMAEGGLTRDELYSYSGASVAGLNSGHPSQVYRLMDSKFSPPTIGGWRTDWEHSSGRAMDLMTNMSGDSSNSGLGNDMARYILDNAGILNPSNVIWQQKINTGGGWQGMPDRGSPTANHMDHVHLFLKGFIGRTLGNAWTGASSLGAGLVDWVGKALSVWKKFVPDLPDLGLGMLGDGVQGFFKNALVSAKDFVVEKAESLMSSGMGGSGPYKGGGNLDEWIRNGFILGNVFEPTAANLSAMKSRVMQESGGNPNAINNWDSNAAAGTPSKGLVQIIEPTWNAHTTSQIGQFDANWMDPVKSVAVSTRYMKARYGYVVGSNGQGYSRGGIVPGRAGEAVMLKAHAGERVLPKEAVRAFDRFSDTLVRAYRAGRVQREERVHRADTERYRRRVSERPDSREYRNATYNVRVDAPVTLNAGGATREEREEMMRDVEDRIERGVQRALRKAERDANRERENDVLEVL